MPHDGREHPTEHLGTARSRRAAIDAATRIYLDGGSLDMSALAEDLGVGRTTLYRWVGNREDLLAAALLGAQLRLHHAALTHHGDPASDTVNPRSASRSLSTPTAASPSPRRSCQDRV